MDPQTLEGKQQLERFVRARISSILSGAKALMDEGFKDSVRDQLLDEVANHVERNQIKAARGYVDERFKGWWQAVASDKTPLREDGVMHHDLAHAWDWVAAYIQENSGATCVAFAALRDDERFLVATNEYLYIASESGAEEVDCDTEDLHAELRIINHLHQGGFAGPKKPPLVYIGVSLLCCAKCAILLDEYNSWSKRRFRFDYRGAHIAYDLGWSVPPLLQDMESRVQVKISQLESVRRTTSTAHVSMKHPEIQRVFDLQGQLREPMTPYKKLKRFDVPIKQGTYDFLMENVVSNALSKVQENEP
ncbi:nucleic acid/nucleotide deaminase domain-containing protein [Archangium lansingense]|uniref:Uncharacterized protein n=1 Tax=Archangium lansingense TaxID=2995310 RepID=A0ABT4AAJ1_9BACT|nr:hypothetical protein [Archangium lansinium]MCY1078674.1 hypothetical protein [Archangium lansinium]